MEFDTVRLLGRAPIDLPLEGLSVTDPYILKSVSGLGPAENDLPGMYANLQPVILVGLNPDYSVGQRASSMRSTFYSLLAPRVIGSYDGVTLQLMKSGVVVAQISGYISKIEPTPFDKDQSLQLTMTCNDSFLSGPSTIYLDPLPADNTSSFTVDNIGDAPAGVILDFQINSTVSYFQITDSVLGVAQKLKVSYPFVPGDHIHVDTRDGHKAITATRLGGTISVIGYLSDDSNWYQLPQGSSSFIMLGLPSYHWNYFQYKPRYWGL